MGLIWVQKSLSSAASGISLTWQLLNRENLRLGLRQCWLSQDPHRATGEGCVVWVLEQCPCHVPDPSCPPVETRSRGANGQVGSGLGVMPPGAPAAPGVPGRHICSGLPSGWHWVHVAVSCSTLVCRWAQQKGTLAKLESFSTAAGNYYFFREKNTVCWNTFLEEPTSHFRHQNKPEPKTVPQRLPGHRCHKWSCKERSGFINQTFYQGGWRGSLYLSDRAQALQTPTQSIGLPKRQATCSSRTGSTKSPSRRVPFATQMCCQT